MLSNSKKGQITVFIIIGIVIVALISVAIFMTRTQTDNVVALSSVPLEMRPVYVHVEDCIKDVGETGIYILGVQGGYINLPDRFLTTSYSDIVYGFSEGRSTLPTTYDMEDQISEFVGEQLSECVNFELFPNLEITGGGVRATTQITENEVSIKVDYPISAKKGESNTKINEFRVKLPIRLGHVHNVLSGILSKTLQDPDWVDMSYISEFDAKVEIIPFNDNVMIYSVTDQNSLKPYIFMSAFAFKPNMPPEFNMPSHLYINDSIPFIMQVKVSDPDGDKFVCKDDTALFDISDDCIIFFTPEVPGEFNVTLNAIDDRGYIGEKIVGFTVLE